MSGRKESVKRERDPKLVKVTNEKKVQFISCIVLKKGLKFSIVEIFPLPLQSQMQNLVSS